jgi:hypothetical protein
MEITMKTVIASWSIVVTAAISLAVPAAKAVTLEGTNVRAAAYCCVAPSEPYRQTEFASAQVTNAVEFGETAFFWFGDGYVSWEGTMDIGPDYVEIHSTVNKPGEPPEGFDGFLLFLDPSIRVVGATLDPVSTLVPSGFSFSDNVLGINLPDAARTTSDYFKIDLTLAPVPEPASYVLILSGILLVVGARQAIDSRGNRRTH